MPHMLASAFGTIRLMKTHNFKNFELGSADKFVLFTGSKSTANIKHYKSHGYVIVGEKRLNDVICLVVMQKMALRSDGTGIARV